MVETRSSTRKKKQAKGKGNSNSDSSSKQAKKSANVGKPSEATEEEDNVSEDSNTESNQDASENDGSDSDDEDQVSIGGTQDEDGNTIMKDEFGEDLGFTSSPQPFQPPESPQSSQPSQQSKMPEPSRPPQLSQSQRLNEVNENRRKGTGVSFDWGSLSCAQRRKYPELPEIRVHPGEGWDIIQLRHDPDKGYKSGPVQGKIRRVVTRGYLLVALPSLRKETKALDRAVLIRGGDYSEAKQRFLNGGGKITESKPSTYLDLSDIYDQFKIICVASTPDEKMTLIEGYLQLDGEEDAGAVIISLSTYRHKYKNAADWQVNLRREMVGQTKLKAKEKDLPAAVLARYASQLNISDLTQRVAEMQMQEDLGNQ